MRFFIWLMILLASAIGLAVLARFNPGNVVLFYPPYRIDFSLNFFIVVMLAGFSFVLAILAAVRATLAMPRRVEQYRAMRQLRESGRALNEALQSYLEGRFGRAEKLAERAATSPDNSGLAALIAARAAQRMQQPIRRDEWLSKADQDTHLKTARLMTAVELYAEDVKETDRALDALRELNTNGIRHTQALRLALKVHQNARNWPEVLRLVRLLDKHKSLHPTLSRRLRDMAYDALLTKASEDSESLKLLWSKVPSEDRLSSVVAVQAALAFIKIGQQIEATAILEAALASQWDTRLLRAYRQSAAPEGSATLLKQIEHCEHWLKERPNDTEISLALGVLCLKQKLWGKAQRHLEQSLSGGDLATHQEAHLRLAQLHEELNQTEAAADHYRQCAMTLLPVVAKS